MRRVCFYHAGCPDGFGAAWAVHSAWGDSAVYTPHTHDDPIDAERYAGDQLVFVDIVPTNLQLGALNDQVEEIVVLDHHVSALGRYQADLPLVNRVDRAGHYVHFDLNHSGAVLAWQHFRADEPVPELLRYVEDQDLWNWKLSSSAEVNAAIAAYPRRFDVWSDLAERPMDELAREGDPIVRANKMEIGRALQHAHPIALGHLRIEAVNSTYQRAPIGHELAERAAFGSAMGCVYRIGGSRVFATLYSIGDLDVSTIAAEYGGGGHRNASGFSVSLERWLADFI